MHPFFFQYVQYEKDDLTDVGVKYKGLTNAIDGKSSRWKAEDNMEMA